MVIASSTLLVTEWVPTTEVRFSHLTPPAGRWCVIPSQNGSPKSQGLPFSCGLNAHPQSSLIPMCDVWETSVPHSIKLACPGLQWGFCSKAFCPWKTLPVLMCWASASDSCHRCLISPLGCLMRDTQLLCLFSLPAVIWHLIRSSYLLISKWLIPRIHTLVSS